MALAASIEFLLLLVDFDFAAATGLPVGLPLLHWLDGTVCEPVLAYFAWSAEKRRVAIASMRGEAYAIRQWFAFCASIKVAWDEPSDASLAAWRDAMEGDSGQDIEKSRVERKLRQVFDFYWLLPRAMPICTDGVGTPSFVVEADGAAPASRNILTFRMAKGVPAWSGATTASRISFPRPTPSAQEVADILTRLRTGAVDARNVAGGEKLRLLMAERNWLMGRCMAEAGLRAQEVADLSMSAIDEMLTRAGLLERVRRQRGRHRLDALCKNETGWSTLINGIERLEREHRQTLRIRIDGKGSKARLAAFPLDLVRDILEIGVCAVRRWQLVRWIAIDHDHAPPTCLFLSTKTKRGFTAGGVGDLMKAAFAAKPVISGSGHRLRAFYATSTAIRIFRESLATTGGVLTRATVEFALRLIAEALGHSSSSTTVRFYLDIAMLECPQPLEHPSVGAGLSPTRTALLKKVALALAGSVDDAKLCVIIEAACRRPDLRIAP